jgi:hypothetical protein
MRPRALYIVEQSNLKKGEKGEPRPVVIWNALRGHGVPAWAPAGRFAAEQYGTGIDQQIEAEIAEAGPIWAPLAAGLFGGSLERRDESLERWRKHIEEARRQARFSHLRR